MIIEVKFVVRCFNWKCIFYIYDVMYMMRNNIEFFVFDGDFKVILFSGWWCDGVRLFYWFFNIINCECKSYKLFRFKIKWDDLIIGVGKLKCFNIMGFMKNIGDLYIVIIDIFMWWYSCRR